jgi:hypothetical protein
LDDTHYKANQIVVRPESDVAFRLSAVGKQQDGAAYFDRLGLPVTVTTGSAATGTHVQIEKPDMTTETIESTDFEVDVNAVNMIRLKCLP